MRHVRTLAALLVAAPALTGCNALFFYETAKVSLTVEARPDSSQPVQGSFGGKQRTVVVSPPMMENGESASMIASFRFARETERNDIFGPIEIHTALVTGEASKGLTERTAAAVAAVVAGEPITRTDDLAARIVERAKADGSAAELQTLVAIPFGSLTEAQMRRLGELTKTGDIYRQHPALHAAIGRRLGVTP